MEWNEYRRDEWYMTQLESHRSEIRESAPVRSMHRAMLGLNSALVLVYLEKIPMADASSLFGIYGV